MWSRGLVLALFVALTSAAKQLTGENKVKMAFEKLTDYDYRGNSYYTAKNLTLSECQSWCRQEPNCLAAAFSFVPNPLTPVQETLCQLQNTTQGSNPQATPQRAVDMYYMIKIQLKSENVCVRPWTFERVPNKSIRGMDNALIYTSSKEACQAACLNEERFVCRSCEYNYATLQCHLSDTDRRTAGSGPLSQLIDSPGVDYFENLCLKGGEACKGKKTFSAPRIGVPDEKISQYVALNFYVDKELQAPSEAACKRACEIETEFLCRSILFRPASRSPSPYNCQLFHLDHRSLPDGPSTFLTAERPLIDTGDTNGMYFENQCDAPTTPSTLPVVVEKTEDSNLFNDSRNDVNCDKTGTCYDVTVNCKDTRIAVQVRTNRPFNGRIYALGRSETCNIDVVESDAFRLDLTMQGQDCNTQQVNGVFTNTVILQHHSIVMTKADKIYKVKCTYDMSPKDVTFGMMPIRDPDTISITSAPEAPPPRIRIVDAARREVETVRIGDRLTFRIEIPEDTPYGIFARSCVAMAKDSKSTFEIIDEEGCPVDPSIFPGFTQDGHALQSVYEAFRFTESYGVIFQCNVKYCLGPCEPAQCDGNTESLGRRRRRREAAALNASSTEGEEDMSISQEILVLDFNDENKGRLPAVPSVPGYTPSAEFGEDPSVSALGQQCSGRGTLLALSVSCALLALLYASTLTFYCARSWFAPKKGFANA